MNEKRSGRQHGVCHVADLGGEVVLGLELLEEGGEEEGGEEEDDGPEEHVGDVGAGQPPALAHTRLGGGRF